MLGEFRAAVDAMGEGAALASLSALALWGIRDRQENEEIYVATPTQRKRRDVLRPVCLADLAHADVLLHEGIPVLRAALALHTAAGVLSENEMRRAIGQAMVLKRASVPQLVEVLARCRGRRGNGRFGRALAAATATRSELEDATVAFLRAHGFPPFATNVYVGPDEVDVMFADYGVVIEADGSAFHDNPIARADDEAKQARLEARGLRVERVRWRDVTAHQAATDARLRDALQARTGGNPR